MIFYHYLLGWPCSVPDGEFLTRRVPELSRANRLGHASVAERSLAGRAGASPPSHHQAVGGLKTPWGVFAETAPPNLRQPEWAGAPRLNYSAFDYVACNMLYYVINRVACNFWWVMRTDVSARVQKHRAALRQAGMRPIQIWVPDTRSKNFAKECRRQMLIAENSDAKDMELHELLSESLDDLLLELEKSEQ